MMLRLADVRLVKGTLRQLNYFDLFDFSELV